MSPDPETLAPDVCYLALKARDARFDGCFYTGVTSTGIYCRPVCRVRTPRRENCRFFGHAAQAEGAGFRPCLRCRPELAPQSLSWSMQDAGAVLAQQAARLLDEPEEWLMSTNPRIGSEPRTSVAPVQQLAARLGVSDRHVRRIFELHLGVSPVQYLQTRRLLTAKQLLADTSLPVTQVAWMSGFASVRRFNAAFAQHYGLSPSRLRRHGQVAPGAGCTVRLSYRPPYDVDAMMGFLAQRAIAGVEQVQPHAHGGRLMRTLALESEGTVHRGWLSAEFDVAHHQVLLQVGDSLHDVLPRVIRRVRAALDLDADPKAINAVLHPSFPVGDGLRVPGAFGGWELAVRAVLGQQVTVAAARTLAQRVVYAFGEPISTPHVGLGRLFPTPAALLAAGPEALGALGIVRQRQAAILALAQALQDGQLSLSGGADVHATIAALKQLPGFGDWTTQYIAMRALRWPDAFPAGDIALHKALGIRQSRQPARDAEAASQAWKPWRSYAVIRSWAGLGAVREDPSSTSAR